jgi:hypothetical protein
MRLDNLMQICGLDATLFPPQPRTAIIWLFAHSHDTFTIAHVRIPTGGTERDFRIAGGRLLAATAALAATVPWIPQTIVVWLPWAIPVLEGASAAEPPLRRLAHGWRGRAIVLPEEQSLAYRLLAHIWHVILARATVTRRRAVRCGRRGANAGRVRSAAAAGGS